MFTRSQFLDVMRQETATAKHLYEKVPEGGLDYRPAEGMRSTLELLRYLTYAALAQTDAAVHDDWSRTKALADAAQDMPAASFPAEMDAQLARIEELVEGLSDADLAREQELPWGEKSTLGGALTSWVMRTFAAYRMQLFLYVKAAGASDLNTWNCWLGVDPPADPAQGTPRS